MKKITVLLMFLAMVGVWADNEIFYPEFEDSVSFYLPFDAGVNADISVGREKPNHVLGKANFMPGLRGNALVCGDGGANIRYWRKDNISFDRPGTLLFFYKGLDWHEKKKSRVFFTGFEGSNGFWGLQLPGWPANLCPCKWNLHLLFLYGKRIPSKTFSIKINEGDGCNKWHMLALSWAPGQLRINADGRPGKTYKIDFDLTDADFPIQVFSVGSTVQWRYLIDEYTIYNRRLSDGELLNIYEKMMKNVK